MSPRVAQARAHDTRCDRRQTQLHRAWGFTYGLHCAGDERDNTRHRERHRDADRCDVSCVEKASALPRLAASEPETVAHIHPGDSSIPPAENCSAASPHSGVRQQAAHSMTKHTVSRGPACAVSVAWRRRGVRAGDRPGVVARQELESAPPCRLPPLRFRRDDRCCRSLFVPASADVEHPPFLLRIRSPRSHSRTFTDRSRL